MAKIYKAENCTKFKRGMMKRGLIYFVVFLLLFSLALAVDTNMGDPCSVDDDCIYLCQVVLELDSDCYCNQGFCFLRSTTASSNGGTTNATSGTNTTGGTITSSSATVDLTNYVTKVSLDQVKSDLSLIQQKVSSLESDLMSLQSSVSGVNNNLQTIQQATDGLSLQQNEIKEELGLQVQAVATGLAGLQNTIEKTKTDVSSLEGTVAEKPSMLKIIGYVVAILILIATIIGIFYYIEKMKHPGVNFGDAVVNYVDKHIKAGRKFHHIKEDLLKAGWQHEDIKKAYHTVAKQNYNSYLKGNSKVALNQDKIKIAVIAVISIFLISGVVFLLSSSAGQAIYLQKGVLDTGEVINSIECTPPHILTPGNDACCLDENANGICDITDERQLEIGKATGQSCTDNLQCNDGKLCINSKCGALEDLYKGSPICDKTCNFYSTKVLTSDGETYYLQPGKGSYTSAGALEWKLLQMPKHCNGEDVIVPVKLVKKNQGKVIGEEVITLHQGETSRKITHSQIPSVKFSLTLDEVYEVCE
ncbi:MAG: hypothetical protein ABIH82_03805 [Candidatus Woesearchaeota archaeon]